jgi:hypothetical protein
MSKKQVDPQFITRDNSHQIEGILREVYPEKNITEKFSTRLFVVDLTYAYQDNIYENYGLFQLVNHRCDLVDMHAIGDRVRVYFTIAGTKKEGTLNQQPIIYTNLSAYRIESLEVRDVPHQSESEWANNQ